MDQKLFERLSALERLNSTNRRTSRCKICGCQAGIFDVVDFNKVASKDLYPYGLADEFVKYFQCDFCGFLFTRFFDDWTPQDFSRFIYNDDYIKVDGEYADIRPERDAALMARRLAKFTHLRILDYGSGSGRFAEHLRARGFPKVDNYDPFSSPGRPDGRFDLVTCFEVLEHTIWPHNALADIASFIAPGGCVIFGTGVQPQNIGDLRANWWYVAPRNGHASIYTHNALAVLAQAVGLMLHVGPGGTAFGGPDPSPESQEILSSVGHPLKFFQLTAPDHDDELPSEQKTCWHGVEGIGAASFRWTRAAEIVWRLQAEPLPPCQLSISIPIKNEIQPGFVNGCRLEFGDTSIPIVRSGTVLMASLTVKKQADAEVKLVMPLPLRPCDLRNVSDSRLLGIAVSTGSAIRH